MIKIEKNLIKRNLNVLKSKQWYNQRFDACLNFAWMISEAEIMAENRKMKGGNFTSHFGIFENHRLDWYIDFMDIERVTGLFLKKAKIENNFSKKLIKKWQPDNDTFFKFIGSLGQRKLTAIKTADLAYLFDYFSSVYLKTITSSSLIDGFALGSDEIIQVEINKLLDKQKVGARRGEIFSILTAPIHQSFINEAEISLFKIAARIKTATALNSALAKPDIKRMLERHQQHYFWTKNNYHDNYVLTRRHFEQELKGVFRSKINISEKISKIQNTPRLNKQRKKALLRQLKPSRYLRNLLKISEDFTYWQDERKKRTFLYTHYASWLLKELGKRFGYSLEQMKYLTRAEVRALVKGWKFSASELAARVKQMFVYQKNNDYEIFSGEKARAAKNYIFKKFDKAGIDDFRGLTASTGKALGRVKLVMSVKEIAKVQSGDILVAVMTRPDYIAGLKKAAAIVTDEGGITCHAAIISRELGIPCIIGTKIATKILKDGDLVEVNANHGWIRKVK